jgi:predicted nucleotidyltransferase
MAKGPRSRSELLAILRSQEASLRARGVESIALFRSLARGGATGSSDVDLAVRTSPGFSSGGFDYFGKLDALRGYLASLLGCDVDLVEEPAVRPRLRRVIAEEGVRAF